MKSFCDLYVFLGKSFFTLYPEEKPKLVLKLYLHTNTVPPVSSRVYCLHFFCVIPRFFTP